MMPGDRLLTPEAVALDIPTASVGWRLASRAIDIVASLLVFDLVAAVVTAIVGSSGGGTTIVLAVYSFGGIAVVLLYPMLMEAFCGGRTLGKLAVGLRVVRTDGGRIDFGQAAVRAGLGLIDVWATFGALATLVIFLSKRDQRLGDMVAGTLVLRERRGRRDLYPVYLMAPPGCEQLVQTMDVAAMTAEEYELVRSFLMRWNDFDAWARQQVAAKLAGPLWQRYRQPLPPYFGPDYYLACLGAAYQFRHPANLGGPTFAPNAPSALGPWAAAPPPTYGSWAPPPPPALSGSVSWAAPPGPGPGAAPPTYAPPGPWAPPD